MKYLCRQLVASALICLGLAAPAWAQFTIPAGGSFDVPAGATIDTGCVPVQVEGNLNINSGQFSTSSNFNIAGTGVLNGNTGAITVGGNLTTTGTFNAGTGTVTLTDGCVGNTTQLSGTLVFQNLVLSSTTGRTFVVPAGTHIFVLGTLALQGAPGQEIQLVSSGGSTAVINLGPTATVNRSFATVAGNVQIGAASAGAVQGIPTLSEYGLILLTVLMSMAAFWHRSRSIAAPGILP